jgi:hypothetical protein
MPRMNFWFEPVIDAYIAAISTGEDWRAACSAAHAKAIKSDPRPPLVTQKDFPKKGLRYCRQHITKLLGKKVFPPPFKVPLG